MIYDVKIAVFATQNCLPKGLGLQCTYYVKAIYLNVNLNVLVVFLAYHLSALHLDSSNVQSERSKGHWRFGKCRILTV
jgi:hypothetical protein